MLSGYINDTFSNFQKLISMTHKLLKEGELVKDNVLDHENKVIKLIRECNVTLRWLMLHTTAYYSGIKNCFQPL